jgi:hypothetical protein
VHEDLLVMAAKKSWQTDLSKTLMRRHLASDFDEGETWPNAGHNLLATWMTGPINQA